MNGRRLALTIAWRTSIRSLGRSALIAAMVAIPIAGLAGVALVGDSMTPTVDERITTALGKSEARLFVTDVPDPTLVQSPTNPGYWRSDNPGLAQDDVAIDPVALFPSGTRVLHEFATTVTATTATGLASLDAIEGDAWDPALEGRYEVLEGRTPQNDREVMVTAATLPRLGAAIGDTVELHDPPVPTMTIVGVLAAHTHPDAKQLLFGRDGVFSGTRAMDRPTQTAFFVAGAPVDWDRVQELNREGITVLSRDVLQNPPAPGTYALESPPESALLPLLGVSGIIAAFAAFEVVLLAGAAFTVTARQQQRMLATMASVGAPRRALRRVLTSSGLVLGAIGGLIGVLLGVAGGAAFMALTNDGSATQYYGFHVPWLLLAAMVAFAVIIGWLAAILPARNASRFDVVAALRGARRPPRPSARRPLAGVVLVAAGVALALPGGVLLAVLLEESRRMPNGHPFIWLPTVMLMVGPLLAQVGLILCGPLLLRGVARLLQHAGLGARLGSRDAARNPGRAVPAVAAIMTTVFVAVVGMSLAASFQQNQLSNQHWGRMPEQVEVPLRAVMWTDTGGPISVAYRASAPVVAALEGSLDLAELRVLSSAPDPAQPTGVEDVGDRSTHPTPRVPLKNLCPRDQNSPEFTDAYLDHFSPESQVVDEDTRCAGAFPKGFKDLLWVGDVDDLALVLGREPSAEAQRVLSSGGAVSLLPEYVSDGRLDIAWLTADQFWGGESQFSGGTRAVSLDAVVDDPGLHGIYFGVFISTATARELGIEYSESTVLAMPVAPPTDAQLDATNAALAVLQSPRTSDLDMRYLRPPAYAETWAWGLLVLGTLIAIAAASVAIGLARFDGRQDDATLASIGGRRLVRRSFAFWQAIVLAGLGTVLGTVIGLIPPLALAANPGTPFAPPWLQIGIVAIGLPLAIACGSWLVATRNTVSARRLAVA